MTSAEEILIQSYEGKTFDDLYHKIQMLTQQKTAGIVVVIGPHDAFIDPVVLNIVSPQIPYMGHIRDVEGVMELHNKSEEGLYLCSLHLVRTSSFEMFSRFEDCLKGSDVENKQEILDSLKEKVLLIIGQEDGP